MFIFYYTGPYSQPHMGIEIIQCLMFSTGYHRRLRSSHYIPTLFLQALIPACVSKEFPHHYCIHFRIDRKLYRRRNNPHTAYFAVIGERGIKQNRRKSLIFSDFLRIDKPFCDPPGIYPSGGLYRVYQRVNTLNNQG